MENNFINFPESVSVFAPDINTVIHTESNADSQKQNVLTQVYLSL